MSLGLTIGAQLNGVIISMAIYGITCCQTLHYFYRFPCDSFCMKAMVAGAWVTETTNAVMLMYTVWLHLIVHRGVQHQHVQWTIIAQTVTAEMAAVGVDCFFIGRINILDARRYRSLILLVPLVISSGAGITTQIKQRLTPKPWKCAPISPACLFDTNQLLQWCLGVFAATRATSDIGIGVAISALIVNIVVRHALATGILASGLAIIYLALNFAYPTTQLWGTVHFIQERVYVNSLLAALNSRQRFRAIAEADASLATIPITIFPDEPYDRPTQLQPAPSRFPACFLYNIYYPLYYTIAFYTIMIEMPMYTPFTAFRKKLQDRFILDSDYIILSLLDTWLHHMFTSVIRGKYNSLRYTHLPRASQAMPGW
ncbi:hypothetical protein FIBSPDRAFT_889703 [Athelia psychrophila]|uniref:DUF6534 domain-containing protein n=1 Tax=Athelia psychrophila TaxID=1759441 RepID=A0A166LU32_9AGAM|nr:hypothetical protein FIBSPDRAFT_889703 [Fibularhizoctonia sp. CBS 109695]